MLIDFVNEVNAQVALQQTVTTTAQATSVDMHDSNVSLAAWLSVGAVSGTSPVLTVQIEEYNPNTTSWQTVVANPATGAGMVFNAVTTSNTSQKLKGLTNYQFVRANAVTVGGTSPSLETFVALIANYEKFPDSATGFDHYPAP